MILSAGNRDHSRLGRDGGEELGEVPGIPGDTCMFACGMDHVLIYTKSGHWYGFGSNECGQLGSFDECEYEKITPLPALDSLTPKWFVCGNNFSAIITIEGEIFAIGETYQTELEKMDINESIRFAAGGWSSLVIIPESTGLYYCFDGDADLKHVCEDIKFIDCGAGMSQFVALDEYGDVYTWGEGCACGQGPDFYSTTPTKVAFDHQVVRVFASNYNTFLVDVDNNVWVSGYNDSGMAGIGTDQEESDTFVMIPQFTSSRIALIAGGREMNYVMTVNGEVFSSGNGEDYKLMQGDDECVYSFTRCAKLEDRNVTYLASGAQHVLVGIDMKDLLEGLACIVPRIKPPLSVSSPAAEEQSPKQLINPHDTEPEPVSNRDGAPSKCCLIL